MTSTVDVPHRQRVPGTASVLPSSSGAAVALPVARVMVDVALAHLDRLFDYQVPPKFDDLVQPGMRVRVRFSGRLVDGYVLERARVSDHPGRLAAIERVVGTEPVLTAHTTRLFRTVADRWAGSFVDVVRLGVPARHARAQAAASVEVAPAPKAPDPVGWSRYRFGSALLAAAAAGRPARCVWSALPGEDWPLRLAEAMQAALAGGRGALVIVPDARDLARLAAAATRCLGRDAWVPLSADTGPARRYRDWTAVRRGTVRAVIGTRAAAYAPVADLGLVAIWDDGDDLHAEPHAPYPHVRDVLALRSTQQGAAMIIGGFARTAEAQLLVETGWARSAVAERSAVRTAAPTVHAVGDDREQAGDAGAASARLPDLALRTARAALAAGTPVLIQVPRRGYVPALACRTDRTPARCTACAGPLAIAGAGGQVACRWCGRPGTAWACPLCGRRQLRAQVVGSRRTAEELGRAFPGNAVRTSGGDAVLDSVPGTAALVVATPGAEPLAEGGYGAALLLDGWALLDRMDLRAGEETLRRWMNAAALVRAGGSVVVGADAAVPAVQALIRWDPGGSAQRELADRRELGFPPATRMAALTGTSTALRETMAVLDLQAGAELIGPVPVAGDEQRLLVRAPREQGSALATALRQAMAIRSARKDAASVRVVLDPAVLG